MNSGSRGFLIRCFKQARQEFLTEDFQDCQYSKDHQGIMDSQTLLDRQAGLDGLQEQLAHLVFLDLV